MNGAEGLGGFFSAVESAARSARTALIEQTIETHGPAAQARAEARRAERPELDRDQLAEMAIGEAAARAAGVGALIALPGLVVGPGTALSVGLAGPEIAWLFRAQIQLVLDLAAIYGEDPSQREERVAEMESLFACAFKTVHSGNTATQILLSTIARAGWKKRALGALLTAGPLKRAGLRRLPALGIPIGAAINMLAIVAIGNEARRRYGGSVLAVVQSDAAPNEQPVEAETRAAEPETGVEEEPATGTAGDDTTPDFDSMPGSDSEDRPPV